MKYIVLGLIELAGLFIIVYACTVYIALTDKVIFGLIGATGLGIIIGGISEPIAKKICDFLN